MRNQNKSGKSMWIRMEWEMTREQMEANETIVNNGTWLTTKQMNEDFLREAWLEMVKTAV